MSLSPLSPAGLFRGPEHIETLLDEGFLKGTFGKWTAEGKEVRGWFITAPDKNPIALIAPVSRDEAAERLEFVFPEEMDVFIQEQQVQIFGQISLEIILKDWPPPDNPLPTSEIEKLLRGVGFSLSWEKLTQHGRIVWLDDMLGHIAKVMYYHHNKTCTIAFNPARGDRQEFDKIAELLKAKFRINEIRIEEI